MEHVVEAPLGDINVEFLIVQDLGQAARTFEVEQLRHAGATQVGIDQQGLLARLSKRDGEIGQRRRLAVTRFGTRDDESLRCLG